MISIIVPVYNRAELVKETLDSILAQTYTDWECIVVDDQSTDNSYEVIQDYAAKDSRIKVFCRPDERIKGGPTCRNIGYENSTGEIIYWFDSDDLLHPQALSAIVSAEQSSPTVEYYFMHDILFVKKIHTERIVIHNRHFDSTPFRHLIRYPNRLITRRLVWRRSFLERSGIQWTEGRVMYQDREFYLRLLASSQTDGDWIPQCPLVFAKRHNKQLETFSSSKQVAAAIVPTMIDLYYVLVKRNGISIEEEEMYLDGICENIFSIGLYYDTTDVAKDFYDSICKIPNVKVRHIRKAYIFWKFSKILYFFSPLRKFLRLITVFSNMWQR
jgi:glycosyltransferase involved in cell wall biosynthesis